MNALLTLPRDVALAWSKAAAGWDAQALADLYSTDALLFGGRADHAIGHAAIRTYFESYDGVIASASLDLLDHEVLPAGPETVLAQGFCEFAFTLAGDRHTRSRLRFSWLLDHAGGEPRIRAHHFSPVPEAPPLGD